MMRLAPMKDRSKGLCKACGKSSKLPIHAECGKRLRSRQDKQVSWAAKTPSANLNYSSERAFRAFKKKGIV